jgi:hypothetical protein
LLELRAFADLIAAPHQCLLARRDLAQAFADYELTDRERARLAARGSRQWSATSSDGSERRLDHASLPLRPDGIPMLHDA